MRHASKTFTVPVSITPPANVSTAFVPNAALRGAHAQVSSFVDGVWVLEGRLSSDQAWLTLATLTSNGLTDVGSIPCQAYRLRCTVVPTTPGSPPLVTLAGWDPSLSG